MRRNSQKWIPFGFDTVSNKIVDIASVENGLSCNCVCLICGTSLIAKQGKNQKWHFSHNTEVKGVCSELTLQHIKKYIKVKIQEKITLLFLIFCKVRSKGSLTSKISLVVGLFVALMLTSQGYVTIRQSGYSLMIRRRISSQIQTF